MPVAGTGVLPARSEIKTKREDDVTSVELRGQTKRYGANLAVDHVENDLSASRVGVSDRHFGSVPVGNFLAGQIGNENRLPRHSLSS